MSGSIVRLSDLEWDAMGEDPCRGAETRWNLIFSADRTETGSISMGMAEIPPGSVLDPHHHEPPEVYHVLRAGASCRSTGSLMS